MALNVNLRNQITAASQRTTSTRATPSITDTGVRIYFAWDGSTRKIALQINPRNLLVPRPSGSTKSEVIGIGEISVPNSPGLRTVTVTSLFWGDFLADFKDPDQTETVARVGDYINLFNSWQDNMTPVRFTVTGLANGLDYDFWVTVEGVDPDVRAGEEGDIYYMLKLREYREYGVEIIAVEESEIEEYVPTVIISTPGENQSIAKPNKPGDNYLPAQFVTPAKGYMLADIAIHYGRINKGKAYSQAFLTGLTFGAYNVDRKFVTETIDPNQFRFSGEKFAGANGLELMDKKGKWIGAMKKGTEIWIPNSWAPVRVEGDPIPKFIQKALDAKATQSEGG